MQFLEKTLANRLILKPKIEKETKSGIIISRDARSQAINTNQGEVFMIGPLCWHDLPEVPEVKVGDLVYYAHYGAQTLQDGEDFYILCSDSDILVGYTE